MPSLVRCLPALCGSCLTPLPGAHACTHSILSLPAMQQTLTQLIQSGCVPVQCCVLQSDELPTDGRTRHIWKQQLWTLWIYCQWEPHIRASGSEVELNSTGLVEPEMKSRPGAVTMLLHISLGLSKDVSLVVLSVFWLWSFKSSGNICVCFLLPVLCRTQFPQCVFCIHICLETQSDRIVQKTPQSSLIDSKEIFYLGWSETEERQVLQMHLPWSNATGHLMFWLSPALASCVCVCVKMC